MHRLSTIAKITLVTALLALAFGVFYSDESIVQAVGGNNYVSTPPAGSNINLIASTDATSVAGQAVTWESTVTIAPDDGDVAPILQIQSLPAITGGDGSVTIKSILSTPSNNAIAYPYDITTGENIIITLQCISTTEGVKPAHTLTVVSNENAIVTNHTYTINCTVNKPRMTTSTNPVSTPADGTNGCNALTGNVNVDIDCGVILTEGPGGSNPANLKTTPNLQPGTHAAFSIAVGNVTQEMTATSGTSHNITVRCNSAVPGTFTGTLRITHNATDSNTPGATKDFPLSCTVNGLPAYSAFSNHRAGGANVLVSGVDTIDLGTSQISVAKPVADAIQLRNLTGTATLNINTITFTGGNSADFTQQAALPLPITAGNVANVQITCTPGGVGLRTTTMTVTHNDTPNSPATYTVQCTGLAPAATYAAESQFKQGGAGAIINGDVIDMGSYALGNATALTNTFRIRNTGAAVLVVNTIAIQAGLNAADFTVNTATPININPAGFADISITCNPSAAGLRQADVGVTESTATNPQYRLNCTGSAGPLPAYSTTPANPSPLAINAPQNGSANGSFTVNNTGGAILTLNSLTIGGVNAANFTVSPNTSTNVAAAGTQAISVTCSPGAATVGTTLNGTLTIAHNATGSPANYTLTCTVTAPGTASTLVSSPAGAGTNGVGSAIAITASLNETKLYTLTLSKTGTPDVIVTNAVLVNNAVTQITFPSTGNPTVPFTITGSNTVNLSIQCLSSAAGTFTDTLEIFHNASNGAAGKTSYAVTCTVSNATATNTALPAAEQTSTAAAQSVPATSRTSCASGTVLSTPFPQNASGEFLLVNCFVVNQAGTVNITVTEALLNPARGVTESNKTIITGNAGLLSVWRMGSWFLVPSTYNAATQTISFQSATGTNIYALFYGGITQPVGAQTATFAGTTTGNVESVAEATSTPPFVPIFSAAFLIFVLMIFFARRQRQGEELAS